MAGPKFFVYGGCRWREVDTTSGSVVGWGNVQFLTLHHGRLEVARKSSVLRGLRSLAASRPTSVHDGPPLSQIRHKKVVENKKEDCVQYQQHHCCCRQHNVCYKSDLHQDAIFNNLLKAATTTTAVQCTLTEINACSEPKPKTTIGPTRTELNACIGPKPKTTIGPTRTELNACIEPKPKTTNRTVINFSQNQVKRLLVKRKRSSDDESQLPNKNIKSTNSRKVDNDLDIDTSLLGRKISSSLQKDAVSHSSKNNRYSNQKLRKNNTPSSSEDDQGIPKLKKSQRLNLERRILGEGTRLRDILKETSRSVKNDKNNLVEIYSSSDDTQERIKVDKSPRKKSENDTSTSAQLTERKETRSSLKNKTTYLTNGEIYKELNSSKRKLSDSKESQVRKVRKTNSDDKFEIWTQESENDDLCKELLISEEDVILLRTFIENDKSNIFNVDLEQFDTSDNYKGLIFYKLNPLVHVETCEQITTMLRQQPSNTVTFEDFMLNLGLRSVLDSSSQASSKYKMRPRRKLNESQKHTSESEPDKENYKKSKTVSSNSKNKVLVENMTKNKRKSTVVSKKIKKKAVVLTERTSFKDNEAVRIRSDSDSDFETSKRSDGRPKAANLKRNNEYSRRVNGRLSRGENKSPSGGSKTGSGGETSKSSGEENKRPKLRESKRHVEDNKRPSGGQSKGPTGDNKRLSGGQSKGPTGNNKRPSGGQSKGPTGDNKRPSGEESKGPTGDNKSPSGGKSKGRTGETKRLSRGENKNPSGREIKKPIRLSGKSSGREYTRAEDEALVQWVAGSMRAKRVNGNQLWIEFQPVFEQITGQFRSWHSLRNRYLRYLLPTLHQLALTPQEAARLRAAAATGELKARKKQQRRNSLLTEPSVRSAWSQRPQPRKSSPSPSRSRSLPVTSPPFTPSTSSTSSETSVRDTSLARRSTLRSSTKTGTNEEATKTSRQLRSSFQTPTHTSSPTYSELTRRYADKHTPSKTQTDTRTDTRRTRRLYNHAM